jgi:ATP-dependent helicase Lhr and Lhr-like helicase
MAIPNEFYPHHANLSRTEREYIEERLRDHASPTTAVCTSTLELGIDIGEVETVAQIGAPYSVASLRQRLGRSGRRAGKAAVMRLYITERTWRHDLHPADALRCELVQAVATIRLLVAGWSEKPRLGALHLSTLVHQILATIAQYGGATANRTYAILCRDGPFAAVTPAHFSRVLRAIGSPEARLIEQAPDGTLLLGETGERLVAHHDFYAVFQTPEEYRVICDGKELGTLPIVTVLIPEMSIIFSGRRWQILDVHHQNRTILVSPGNAGVPPLFGGEAGELDDAIVAEMRRVYESDDMPRFLNQAACALLAEGRQAYRDHGLMRTNILGRDNATFLFPWAGTVAVNTLVLALKAAGISASVRHSIIEVEDTPVERVRTAITHLATSPPPDAGKLAGQLIALRRQKYDRFLSPELLILGFAADQLAPSTVGTLARTMMGAPD